MQEENRSEVARLIREIEMRYTSARWGMEGTAIKAPHEFITRQMENLGIIHEKLIGLVGTDEAIKIVADSLWTPADQGSTST
jgi:hypothetical protein